jgi:Fe-S oxidoreductase
MMPLETFREYIYRCMKCGSCRLAWGVFEPSCPSGSKFIFDSHYAGGRLEIARALIEGNLEWSDRLLHRIYTCTTCGACDEQCYPNTAIKPLDVIMELRNEIVNRRLGPLPKHKSFAESIRQNHNPYMEKAGERTRWMHKDIAHKGELLYFTGCTSSYRQDSIARATVKILEAAGLKYSTLGAEEWCCGSPLLRTGMKKDVLELVNHNIEAISKSGAEKVILSCAGCYNTIKRYYPELLGISQEEFATKHFQVYHISQFIEELIKEGKLSLRKEVKMKATYHDPCHLGRQMKVYEPPRNVLKKIPCVELVEMERNRESAWCCGAGGGVKSGYPDFAIWSATERLKDVKQTNADTIVTACPFCVLNLKDAVKANAEKYPVLDLTEVVAQAI